MSQSMMVVYMVMGAISFIIGGHYVVEYMIYGRGDLKEACKYTFAWPILAIGILIAAIIMAVKESYELVKRELSQ